jgi:hypothetical protein
MSFALTKDQIIDRSKTVTRRAVETWNNLQAGDRLKAVNRVMGFRLGEKQVVLGQIEVTSVTVEALSAITDEEVAREGFPGMDAAWFVGMFCKSMKKQPGDKVRRIEFRHV